MRLEQFVMHQWGPHRDRVLDLTPPDAGIVLVYGPNEAGKSSTMRAIDAFLYGIELRTTDHHGGGRASLRLEGTCRTESGEVRRLVRVGSTKAPLEDPDGNPVSDQVMLALLGGVERSLFRSLFRIDHHQLADGSEELLDAEGELGRLLFGAALGSGALAGLQRRLDEQMANLFKAGGSKPAINATVSSYRSELKSARDLRVRPRAWAERDARRTDILRALDRMAGQEAELETRRSQLERIKLALPLFQRRRLEQTAVEAVRLEGVVPSSAWADEVLAAVQRRRSLHQTAVTKREFVASRQSQLDSIVVNSALIRSRSVVQQLLEDSGRYRKDLADLPKLREKLRAETDAFDTALERAGLARDSLDELLVATDAKSDDIDELGAEKLKFESELANASSELAQEVSAAERMAAELAECGDAPQIDELLDAVSVAAAVMASEDSAADRRRQLVGLDAQFESKRARMGLVLGTPVDASRAQVAEALRAIVVPAASSAQHVRDLLRSGSKSIAEFESVVADRVGQHRDAERELDVAQRSVSAPSKDELDDIRLERDSMWHRIRVRLERLTSNPGSEADAANASQTDAEQTGPGEANTDSGVAEVAANGAGFDQLIERADTAADERYAVADRLARIEQLTVRVEHLAVDLAEARANLETATERLDAVTAEWNDLWPEQAGRSPDPEDGLRWLEDHAALCTLADDRVVLEAAAQETTAAIDAAQQRLSAHISTSVGETRPGDFDRLRDMLQVANRSVAEAETKLARRRELEARERELRDRIGKRTAAKAELEARQTTWEQRWSTAVRSIALEPSATVSAATSRLRLMTELRTRRDAESSTKNRLNGLIVDVERYETRVRSTIGELDSANGDDAAAGSGDASLLSRSGAHDDRADAHDDVVRGLGNLTSALDLATNSQAVRDQLATDIAAASEDLSVLDLDIAGLDSRISDSVALLGLVSLPSEAELIELCDRGRTAARAAEKLSETENLIVAQGGGKSLADIEDEVESSSGDPDALSAELLGLQHELAGLREQRSALERERGENDRELALIDGSGAAADAEQTAAELMADLATHVDEYSRVALAAGLLRRVMAEYAERNQGPILRESSTMFELLTRGAFDALVPDIVDNKQVILARRANGDLRSTGELSDGTRDQMYLALRLAAVVHHLDLGTEPVPLILDDLLLNFDDERAAAALEALASVGSRTQVLMFSHERSLVDLASRHLGPKRCSVVEMDRRTVS